jgi:hypothetical protein
MELQIFRIGNGHHAFINFIFYKDLLYVFKLVLKMIVEQNLLKL